MVKAGIAALSIILMLAWACGCPPQTAMIAPLPPNTPAQTRQEAGPRTPLVPPTHPAWVRVEAAERPNSCKADDQCFVSGCDAEMCSARAGLSSKCVGPNWPSKGGLCGCLAGKCTWYKARATLPR